MTSAQSINPSLTPENQETDRLAFRREDFHCINEQTGEVESGGCELLLNIENPREFLEKTGLDGKERALADGIHAAKQLPDEEMVSVNVDPDWANDIDRLMGFEAFRDLPANIILEITEVEKLDKEAALILVALALQHEGILIDDMPTDESLNNMAVLFEVMESVRLKYGIKVDFKTTHALLGRPMEGDPAEMREKALNDLYLMRSVMNTSAALPTWIIFEGLTYVDELETVTRDFAPIIDPRQKENKAKVLGQFFRNEVKTRE